MILSADEARRIANNYRGLFIMAQIAAAASEGEMAAEFEWEARPVVWQRVATALSSLGYTYEILEQEDRQEGAWKKIRVSWEAP
jgi:hypothetical protein